MSTPNCRFDLDLFIELNKEYESKPIVPRPRQHHAPAMVRRCRETRREARRTH